MTHSFIAYIDESGDDGLAKFREPGRQGGASNWLVISACVMRYAYHLSAVAWRDEISAFMPEKKSRHIHFSEMNHHQKVATVQCLARKPLRAISVISAKRTIPDGVYTERNQLYFYLTRYLVERISWFCRDIRPSVPEGDGTIKIIFSRRGGMSYADFRGYIDRLRRVEDQEINIHWPVIKTENIDAQDHSRVAGLQIVDVIASAFANGFEPDRYGNCEPRYAEILKPVVYNRKGQLFELWREVGTPTRCDIAVGRTASNARFVQMKWAAPRPMIAISRLQPCGCSGWFRRLTARRTI